MLKAGYIKEDILQESRIGVNQGSILSPFLFNVYMHDLDVFVEGLNKKVSINNRHSEETGYGDPEAKRNYRKLTAKYSDNLLKTYKKLGSKEKFSSEKKKEFLEHYKKYGRKMGIDKTNRYVQYVRYADDFLFGIIGPRSFAVAMQKEINMFIKSDLHLEVSKNSIIHRDQPAVTFLGHRVQLVNFHGKTKTKQKHLAAIARFKNRSIQRLKTQNVNIAKAALNRLRSKMLKQIDFIAKQLNISYSNQKLDTYSAILAFKNIGVTLAKSLKLSNFEELTRIMEKIDENTNISNPAIKRLYNQFKSEAELNEEIAANCVWEQIKRLENSEMFKIEGIGQELKLLQKDMETKAEEIAKRTKNKLIDEKRGKLLQIHTKKQNKKIANRIGTPLSNEEKEILIELAYKLAEMDLEKESVRTISIRANIEQFCKKLRENGFIHPIKEQACSCNKLTLLSDVEIISHYNSVITGTLSWFSGADNFQKVKSVIEHILRKSCLLTLKRKFKMKSFQQAYDIYGRDVAVKKQDKIYSLITKDEVSKYRNSFNLGKGKNENEFNLYKIIDKVKLRSHGLTFLHSCVVVGCENKDIEIHHINKLQRKRNNNGIITVIDKKGEQVKGLKAVLTSINRKQLPLCRFHHIEMEEGKYHELNKNIINEVLNKNSIKYSLKMPKDFKTVFEGNPFVYNKLSNNSKKS